jgi:formate hydrogenlyase subunit 6/NADH:ubiquinone oxidoreductase subunit I
MANRRQPKSTPAPWLWREIPILNETACTGCGLCCALCPTDCLAMHGPVPWMPRPAACIGCGVCAAICPADALVMKAAANRDEIVNDEHRH